MEAELEREGKVRERESEWVQNTEEVSRWGSASLLWGVSVQRWAGDGMKESKESLGRHASGTT